MQTFLISYDLTQPAHNKHAVATAIMSLGQSWARPLEHTWYVRAETSEFDVRDRLAHLLDDEDGLIVQSVSEDAALSNTHLRWFRQRQPSLDTVSGASNVFAFPVVPNIEANVAANEDRMKYAQAC